MRFVPWFFILATIGSGFALHAETRTARLHACEHTVTLTDFAIDPSPGDSLRATTVHANRTWTLLILCRPNLKKTNPAEELILEARERGDLVRDVEEIKTQLGPSTLFKRTSHETLVMRLEGNAASREFVYLYVMIPEKGKSASPQEWQHMQKILGQILTSAKSENQTTAIAEASFRKRLVGFLFGITILVGGIAWFMLRRILKGKSQTARRK